MSQIALQSVSKEYADGTRAVDGLDLEIGDGEFMILVGPSGCGKSTALRMVAGLEEITGGDLFIDGQRVNDVEPKRRDVAMVFQTYALYPHMTVRDNMGFALRMAKVDRKEIRSRVDDAARILDLTEQLDRKPANLSGGQRQRVAMGRAIVRNPKAFLMDEPLSNLDAKLRVQMRAEISSLQERLQTTTVYVTHDQVEAMTLGDRVAVMRLGVLQQVGAPRELYRRPANMFVAGFLGSPPMNFLDGEVADGTVRTPLGTFPLPAAARAGTARGPVVVGLRPEAFSAAPADAPGAVTARVATVEMLGAQTMVHLPVGEGTRPAAGHDPESWTGQLVAALPATAEVAAGDQVSLSVDATQMHLFDPTTERRIGGEEG